VTLRVTGNYSIQARLLPGQTEVTGPPPSGNSTDTNYCKQVTDLKALGKPAGTKWYMLQAVREHENVHASRFTPALRDPSVAPVLDAAITALSVADTGQGEAAAIAQITALPGWATALADAYTNWLDEILRRVDHDHDLGGPCDTAEHAIVDPMATSICTYAAAHNWPACAVCP
jgi:hypothetical protein